MSGGVWGYVCGCVWGYVGGGVWGWVSGYVIERVRGGDEKLWRIQAYRTVRVLVHVG